MELKEYSRKAVELLLREKKTVALAESCTGGLIASTLVDWPGVSEALLEGCVCYTDEAKRRTPGVSAKTLERDGAVSETCARELAIGMRAYAGSDYALSVTGIAGPGGGTKEMPVGLVYIGLAEEGSVRVDRRVFPGDRTQVRRAAAEHALKMLIQTIEEQE